MLFLITSGDGTELLEIEAKSPADAIEQAGREWAEGVPDCFLPFSAVAIDEKQEAAVVSLEVLAEMTQGIAERHPMLRIRTQWIDSDWQESGIEIHARHDATGNTLCDSLSKQTLADISVAQVCTWADESVRDWRRRIATTRQRKIAEKEMDR